jgi:fructose-1,6-bisphosphatase
MKESIIGIEMGVNALQIEVVWLQTIIKDLNEKVDLLTIRKQVDRQDKEKRIKDTLVGCTLNDKV